MTPLRAARQPILWLVMTLAAATAVAADTPQTWLDRMNAALTMRNYVGVFSHWQDGRVVTLRIVHRVMDGAVTELLESLDGSGRQFVRSGTELTCYLPDQRTVLVERATQSLMPAGLPKFDAALADFYQVESQGTIREMGQQTQVISVTGRRTPAEFQDISEVRIGGLTIHNVPLAFAQLHTFDRFGLTRQPALLLGMDVLSLCQKVTVDLRRHEATFTLN